MNFPSVSYNSFLLLNAIWIAIGIITFLVLLRINAPYGRYTNRNWGPLISNKLAWFLMEIPVLLIVGISAFYNNENLSIPVFIMAGLFCLHYLHRSLLFPLRIRTKGKQMPVVIMCSAILFNLANGFFLGYYFHNFAHYEYAWMLTPQFITGLIIFIAGAFINIVSDSILIRLRKPGEAGYSIPNAFLFKWVSCPNHLGEMLEWLGFALICSNLPAWSFFIWTVANLLPRSIAHHKWYKQKFPSYPSERKAVIPYFL